jgi:actin-related protein
MNIAHAYKSMKTNSSMRSIVFKKGIEEDFQETNRGKNIRKVNEKKKPKKINRTKDLEVITYEDKYDGEEDKKNKSTQKLFYYTFHNEVDSQKNELIQLFQNSNHKMIHFYTSGLRIVNTTNGAIMMKKGYPVFILVKRKDSLEHNKNGRADHDCLEWLMTHHNNVNLRGSEKSGFSEKYVTVGAHGSHFEKGFHIKKLKGKHKEFFEPYLKKMVW